MVADMEPRPSDPKPDIPHNLVEVGLGGLLLSRDLIFITKIKGTAADLGHPMLVASTKLEALSMITTYRPPVVLVDLTASELAEFRALNAYRDAAGSDAWLVAFGPHVDVDALATAKAADFHVVLPRSLFAAKLAEFLRRYFTQAPEKNA